MAISTLSVIGKEHLDRSVNNLRLLFCRDLHVISLELISNESVVVKVHIKFY